MLGDRFRVARVPASIGVEEIRYLQHTSGYAGVLGSVLVYSSGEVAVAGANPTSGIVGVALAPANSAPGYGVANNPTVFTGRNRKIAVAIANRNTVFSGYCTNGSSTKVTPTIANVGVTYGITAYSGIWTIDLANTNDCVEVVGWDDLTGATFFRFMTSAIVN